MPDPRGADQSDGVRLRGRHDGRHDRSPPLIVEPDATSLAAEDMRAAASALRAAADALLHMATARGAGEGADDSNAEDTNSG